MNIILICLGFLLYWIANIMDVKSKHKERFYFALFFEENILKFIYGILATIVLYFVINADLITANNFLGDDLKFIDIVKVTYFLIGYAPASLLNRIIGIWNNVSNKQT